MSTDDGLRRIALSLVLAARHRRTGGLRTAIVGAGLMGRFHADAVVRAGSSVAWVVDRDRARARELAERHEGSSHAVELGASVLEDVDVVHLCTPLDTHVGLAASPLTAARHVLCEKPLAVTAADTEELLALAERHQVQLCPTHQYLFQRGTMQALAALPKLGTLLHIDATACSAGAAGRAATDRARLAGEILPHPLSLLCRMLGPELGGCSWSAGGGSPGELRATTTLRGATLALLVSARGRPTVNALRIVAERGTVHLDFFHGYAVIEPGRVSRARKVLRPVTVSTRTFASSSSNLLIRTGSRETAYPGLRELVGRFHRAARDGTPPPIAASETLAVARARDRILQAVAP